MQLADFDVYRQLITDLHVGRFLLHRLTQLFDPTNAFVVPSIVHRLSTYVFHVMRQSCISHSKLLTV
jgi:hypothetical protein